MPCHRREERFRFRLFLVVGLACLFAYICLCFLVSVLDSGCLRFVLDLFCLVLFDQIRLSKLHLFFECSSSVHHFLLSSVKVDLTSKRLVFFLYKYVRSAVKYLPRKKELAPDICLPLM